MDRKLNTAEPKGYEIGEGNAFLLNTALYGPVQSAYLLFEEIKGTLKEYGLIQSRHDDELVYNPATELYVTVYVDEINTFARTDAPIDNLSNYVSKKYELTERDGRVLRIDSLLFFRLREWGLCKFST